MWLRGAEGGGVQRCLTWPGGVDVEGFLEEATFKWSLDKEEEEFSRQNFQAEA